MSKEKRQIIRLLPKTSRFVNGIASSYDDTFPPELKDMVEEMEFEKAINQINNTLTDYWPCMFCICCGYACCLCTAGLSLLCPNLCISDAEAYARTLIERINYRQCFQRKSIEWELVKSYGKSWIEISYPLNETDPVISCYQTLLHPHQTISNSNGYGSASKESILYSNGDTSRIESV